MAPWIFITAVIFIMVVTGLPIFQIILNFKLVLLVVGLLVLLNILFKK